MTWDERMITTVTTGTQLRDALLAVGLDPTDSCIVHTRLSAFGFIPGGEQTVVDVLKSVLYDGDIMMSAQTMDLSDSRYWGAPPVSPELIGTVNAALPAFNPETTPVHGIGHTPEYFRALPGTRRSSHPLYSMSAWGRHADWLCGLCGGEGNHDYDMPFGEHSPLARLYEIDGKVLFLGTGFETCTAIHYAESTIGRPHIQEIAPIGHVDAGTGERATEWTTFGTVELDRYDDFESFGDHFLSEHSDSVCTATLHEARILAFPIRDLVDIAREYYMQLDFRHSDRNGDDPGSHA